MNAGTDMHMHGPNFLSRSKETKELYQQKELRMPAGKILLAKFKLGLFENRY